MCRTRKAKKLGERSLEEYVDREAGRVASGLVNAVKYKLAGSRDQEPNCTHDFVEGVPVVRTETPMPNGSVIVRRRVDFHGTEAILNILAESAFRQGFALAMKKIINSLDVHSVLRPERSRYWLGYVNLDLEVPPEGGEDAMFCLGSRWLEEPKGEGSNEPT